MRLEVAETQAQCKLWVTPVELEALQRVARTGDPLILPDHVVQHLKDHRHEAWATFPARHQTAMPLGIAIHVEREPWEQ